MTKFNSRFPKSASPLRTFLLLAALFGFSFSQPTHAQWIAYNFNPQTAYRASTGMSTNNNGSISQLLSSGWPATWDNANLRGVLAIQFNTNVDTFLGIDATGIHSVSFLPPLIYTYNAKATNGTLDVTNYKTDLPALTEGVPFVTARVNYGSRVYMAGNYADFLVDTNDVLMTNLVASFKNLCTAYTTNALGTNGVASGTSYYPPVLTLNISILGRESTDTPFTKNQNLVVPLTINTNLTKIMNTNTNFGPAALTDSAVVYTNLPKLIRSNSTYTNF